jgi:hypothetical protein
MACFCLIATMCLTLIIYSAEAATRDCCPTVSPFINCIAAGEQACSVKANKCGKAAQCCGVECGGTKCTTTKRLCPCANPNIDCITNNPIECYSSSDCSSGYSCCEYECGGKRCVRNAWWTSKESFRFWIHLVSGSLDDCACDCSCKKNYIAYFWCS